MVLRGAMDLDVHWPQASRPEECHDGSQVEDPGELGRASDEEVARD